ncbi:uncharacterized protein LOC143844038 [Paroedura picta]|uniref:uncharacterized protein LOC143844038 n=1 Tax=Paroedura picta TaxID=143630 RepID=UPI0040573501
MMNSTSQSSSVQGTGRGPTWRDAEIRDLMAIFAEEHIQDAFRSSHRNREVFEEVAMRMRTLDHQRTGLECCSKTKTRRAEYLRCVTHNKKLGNARVTCPYFDVQREIFGEGDGDGRPKRVGRSLKVIKQPAAPVEGPAVEEDPGEGTSTGRTVRPPPQKQPRGADLITLDLLAIIPGEETSVLEQTPLASEVLSEEDQAPVGAASPLCDVPRGALSAEERLQRERRRQRRVSMLTNIGQRLLEQCEQDMRRSSAFEEAMLGWERERAQLELQESRLMREVFRETNETLRGSVEEMRLIRGLVERVVLVMEAGEDRESANPPQINVNMTPPPPPPTPPTPSQSSGTQTRRRTLWGKRKVKSADKYSPS